MMRFFERKPKVPSYLRRIKPVRSENHQELNGDGLTPDTAFVEGVIFGRENDYARFLEPLHGKEGVEWSVIETIPIHTGHRHYFLSLVTFRLINGETKQYYFDRSANIKITYADELMANRKVEKKSWWKSVFNI